MEEKQNPPSLWQTARVEVSTLAVLVLGWTMANVTGYVPDVNTSLGVVIVYAAWIALCVGVYRYFYQLDA